MRSQHLAMTVEEFELMERELGWKYEYWDGKAHISPGHRIITTSLNIKPRSSESPCELRAVEKKYEPGLVSSYLAAFRDSMEYCDWEEGRLVDSAKKVVTGFLSGERGKPLRASRLASVSQPGVQEPSVVGAALLVRRNDGCPLLDGLFVSPEWQRKGVATALVSSAIGELCRGGIKVLQSAYVLGNHQSRAWHRRFGFVEEISEVDRWKAHIDELEIIAEREGLGSVLPILRR